MTNLSVNQLKAALEIQEKIEKLQSDLNHILGGSEPKDKAAPTKRGRRKFSPATIARMRASQQARWATPGVNAPVKAKTKKKSGLTPAGRARLAASMKARWAARRKSAATPAAKAAPAPKKKTSLTPTGRERLAALMKARWAAKKKAAAPAPDVTKK